ncbi:integrator complex subunit 9-like, partial [Saccostrea cucullata]|uniref:integrator complex subunit 9-like n=1 Tax=Saccostrea cuccullata TaxID=36930 RepID=UPI002ED12811
MLDCGLDIAQILKFLPLSVAPNKSDNTYKKWIHSDKEKDKILGDELREVAGSVFVDGSLEFCSPELGMTTLSEVDAILLSNHNTMLALPYITEYSGFKGTIYCTEPTLQIGRQYMEELVTYVERNPQNKKCSKWKSEGILSSLPAPLREAIRPTAWRECYTRHDIQTCLSKVQTVGYNEKRNIFGALTITACSSGYSIGSCNWTIKSPYQKICYISGTSTLTTHPKPMDTDPLRQSDLIILSSMTKTPGYNPDQMIGEFCVNTVVTIKNGGNVLVPCYPSGMTFDLFECLSGHLDSCGLTTIPLYFLSPVSDSSLAYSNIYAEWLSTSKQNKVYLPEPPFPHAELVSIGRLRHYTNIHDGLQNDFKSPCIVFAGHPSLRMGDVVHFMELWGKSSSNTILFT